MYAVVKLGRAFVPPAPRSANAHQVVRPLNEGDGPVRWWVDADASTDAGSDDASYASSDASVQVAIADRTLPLFSEKFASLVRTMIERFFSGKV